jgi:rod shape-determining protein MreD
MLNSRHYCLIVTSILLAIVLNMLPLPEWAYWFRPEWVLLVLIYWIMLLPHRINVGCAWSLGLLVDVMNGSLLGEHALAFTLIAYIVARWHQWLRLFSFWQQSIIVLLFVLLYQLVLFIIQGMIGEAPQTWSYWFPSLASMLFWPCVFVMLRDWRRRLRISE